MKKIKSFFEKCDKFALVIFLLFIISRAYIILLHPALTTDEHYSIVFSITTLFHPAYVLFDETNPILYYIYLLPFTTIFYQSEFVLRCSTLIPFLLFFGWFILKKRNYITTALALILSVFPFAVFHSYEIRSYGISMVLFVYLLDYFIEKRKMTLISKILFFIFINLHFLNLVPLAFILLHSTPTYIRDNIKIIAISTLSSFSLIAIHFIFGSINSISWFPAVTLSNIPSFITIHLFNILDASIFRWNNTINILFINALLSSSILLLYKKKYSTLLYLLLVSLLLIFCSYKPLIAPHATSVLFLSLIACIFSSWKETKVITTFWITFSLLPILMNYTSFFSSYYYTDYRSMIKPFLADNREALPLVTCFVTSTKGLIDNELTRHFSGSFINPYVDPWKQITEYKKNSYHIRICNSYELDVAKEHIKNGFYYHVTDHNIKDESVLDNLLENCGVKFNKSLIINHTFNRIYRYQLLSPLTTCFKE